MTANPRNPALSDIGDGAMPEGMEGLLKQLVWEDVDEICTRCVAPVFGGKMIVVEISPGSGEYSAGIDLGGLCFRLIQDAYDDNGFRYSAPKNFGSIDAAKAAAQSDYTARVLSAVDPDEITRLRAALADAQAVGFAAGVEAAAKRVGFTECPACGGEGWEIYDHEEHDCQTCFGRGVVPHLDKSALTPPDATAAAAMVLLGVWPTDVSFDAAFNACAASYHGGDQMQDVMDRTRATVSAALRAIAGDTP